MNTTVASISSLSAEHAWLSGSGRSRRDSAQERRRAGQRYYVLANESPLRHSDNDDDESILSIQARETDYVKDTSDTESYNTEPCDTVEYEPVSDTHSEQLSHSDESEEEIICTQVISVKAVRGEDVDADSEGSDDGSDPELGPHDYWRCAQCRNTNNNPLYRYCYKCFQVRKNLFPPRPKRRTRAPSKPEQQVECSEPPQRVSPLARSSSLTSHLDSGFDSAYNSQELTATQESLASSAKIPSLRELCTSLIRYNSDSTNSSEGRRRKRRLERRGGGLEPAAKRRASSAESGASDAGGRCALEMPTRAVVACLRREVEAGGSLCVVCCSEPRSAVFVHTKIAHICCCYRCAVRVWASAGRCPVCNRPVRNVLKAVM